MGEVSAIVHTLVDNGYPGQLLERHVQDTLDKLRIQQLTLPNTPTTMQVKHSSFHCHLNSNTAFRSVTVYENFTVNIILTISSCAIFETTPPISSYFPNNDTIPNFRRSSLVYK